MAFEIFRSLMQRCAGRIATADFISGHSVAKGRAALDSHVGVLVVAQFWTGFWTGLSLAVAVFLFWLFTL